MTSCVTVTHGPNCQARQSQRDVHPRQESCKFPLCHKTTFVPEFRVLFSVDWTLRHDSPRFGPWNGLKSPRHYLRTPELISATLSSTSIHLSLCLARRPYFTSSTCLFDVSSRTLTRSPFIMSQPPAPRIADDDDNDTSRVSTPILVHLPASPPRPSSLLPSGSTSSESTKPATVLPSAAHLRLPIPTLSANLSQTSFTFVDVTEDGSGVDFEDLPPEVNSADISIAREFLYSTSVSRLCVFYAHAYIVVFGVLFPWNLNCIFLWRAKFPFLDFALILKRY